LSDGFGERHDLADILWINELRKLSEFDKRASAPKSRERASQRCDNIFTARRAGIVLRNRFSSRLNVRSWNRWKIVGRVRLRRFLSGLRRLLGRRTGSVT